MNKHSGYCLICNREIPCGLTKHHVKPKNKGGRNTEENYFYVCRDCHNIIDRISPTHIPREIYTNIICKMLCIMRVEYPKYYTEEYVYSLLRDVYGITAYELDILTLIDYINNYKGNIFHLYYKLREYNSQLPANKQIKLSFDFNTNKIIIDEVTFEQTDSTDNSYKRSYHWKSSS
jgi:hypothetical protein